MFQRMELTLAIYVWKQINQPSCPLTAHFILEHQRAITLSAKDLKLDQER